MANHNSKDQISPYRGLRYYEANHADFFAGRTDEARDCTKTLGSSRVMILHGRSGCGKSSFLRAGVKPLLERADKRSAFAENFEVVRSTGDPLKAFAAMLLQTCDQLVGKRPDPNWKPKKTVSEEDLDAFKTAFDTEEKRGAIVQKPRMTHKLLTQLTGLLEKSPVFVVDQGEEVFTLVEKQERDLAKEDLEDPKTKAKKAALEDLKRRGTQFFDFLGRVSSKGPANVRIVVSLRTEYKGQLDDRISSTNYETSAIKGYYLDDLDENGLEEAILRPTLKGEDWKELQKSGSVSSGEEPYKSGKFDHFCFDPGVAKALARRLIDSGQVPEGGVLPTLQIACLRLWEQAVQAKGGKGHVRIKHSHLKRLGKIDNQVQDFLEQRLEEACFEFKPWVKGESEAAENWHRILFDALVDLQADGRAVTKAISEDELVKTALDYFSEERDEKKPGKASEKIRKVIEFLTTDGISLLNRSKADGTLSLGHDSVALSLNKWKVKYGGSSGGSMRMMMEDGGMAYKYKQQDLFPKGQKPHQTDILIHRDDHWDRQYTQFALENGFAERLGVNFITDDKFDLTVKSGRGRSKDWNDLADRLRKRERQSYRKRTQKTNRVNERVLVAADWNAFPRVAEEATDLTGEALEELWGDQVQDWSDILVTDLFTGNALVGPDTDGDDRLSKARDTTAHMDAAESGEVFREVVRSALLELVENKGIVACHDMMACRFIEGAAKLTCGYKSDVHKYVTNPKNVHLYEVEDTKSHYPLADWFLDEDADAGGRPRYMVGTAATRAIALQGGGHLYFGTSELTRVARATIKDQQSGKTDDVVNVGEDVHKLIQRTIKHTTWQLGIAPAQWNQGRSRALVLRLASIGYFTAEYIRSNADVYVRYVRNRVNERLSNNEDGISRGVRMNRDAIRSAIQECYGLFRFDEYGSEFYDLDSTLAYATEHERYDSKSVAGEIYNELAYLKQRTIVHYETMSRMIRWLRARDAYGQSDPLVAKVTELKDCAWRNYRIFNYYDSARLMSDAALILQRKMEDVDLNSGPALPNE